MRVMLFLAFPDVSALSIDEVGTVSIGETEEMHAERSEYA